MFEAWQLELRAYLDQTTGTKESPFATNLFHLMVGDPGFWCQLGTFLAAGAVFRRLGFGDGLTNSWLLDLSTFTIGWYLTVVLRAHMNVYKVREQAGSAMAYAASNFATRMAIVPFTSTFVPLLFGYKTASMENIAACWVQHFVALAASHWSLAPGVVGRHADLTGRPYASAARTVEELRVRVGLAGPFADASSGAIVAMHTARTPATKTV